MQSPRPIFGDNRPAIAFFWHWYDLAIRVTRRVAGRPGEGLDDQVVLGRRVGRPERPFPPEFEKNGRRPLIAPPRTNSADE